MAGRRAELGRVERVIAAVLAALWIAGGLAAFIVGLVQTRWLPILVGPVGVAYGLAWIRVARTGRYLKWPRFSRRTDHQ